MKTTLISYFIRYIDQKYLEILRIEFTQTNWLQPRPVDDFGISCKFFDGVFV